MLKNRPHPDHATEEATVRAFFSWKTRERFVLLLRHPKRRGKALNALNHFDEFDERFVTRLHSTSHGDVAVALHARGAPDACYSISDVPSLDARVLPLDDAIADTTSGGFASLLCCIPGQLACFIGEAGTRRWYILEKQSNAAPVRALEVRPRAGS